MVFKKLLGALGVGGPSVDTVLNGGAVVPGSALSGQVLVRGGTMDSEITQITLDFAARVERETEEGEGVSNIVFHRETVGGAFKLAEGQQFAVPFTVTVPWETPITEIYGQPLGVVLGVRTELAVAGAVDQGDLDPLLVRPLPAQEAILEGFGQLGFGFKSADLEYGRIRGTNQSLPFYQEIELTPSAQYAGVMNEIEVTFLTSPGGVDVIIEADKRGGLFSGGGDALTRVSVSHQNVESVNWTAEVDSWMRKLTAGRGHH